MELTPGVIIAAVVVVAAAFLFIRWSRRHEAAAPTDAHRSTPVKRSVTTARDARENPLVDWLLDRAFEQTGIDVANDSLARQRIAEAASKAMDELQGGGSATISLPFITADARGPKHFAIEFKRNPDSTFEQLH